MSEGKRSALSHGWRLMPRALPYLRPYRVQAIGAVAITIVLAVLAVSEPWPLALVIDTVLGNKPVPYWVPTQIGDGKVALILTAVAASMLITLFAGLFTVVNEFLVTNVNLKIILDFRSDMLKHTLKLSPSYHDETKTGVTLYRINSQAGAMGPILTTLPELAQSTLTVFGMAFITYRIDASLALVALTVVPVIMFATRFYANRIEPDLNKVRGMEGNNLSIVHEILSMLRVIVTFGREKYEFNRFREQGDRSVEARVRLTVRQTIFKLVVNFITAAGTAAVLGWGAHRVLQGDITLGQLTVVLTYVASVYAPLEQLTNTLTWYQLYWNELEHALQLIDTPVEVEEKPGARAIERTRGHIRFENVDFSYHTREEVLRGINLDIPAGGSIAVVGPTGAGKSTLISLMPRLYDPAHGRVLLDDVPLDELTLESVRDQFAIVLQEPLLFSGSIADNIRYGRLEATQSEIEEAAKAANAHDFISKLPKGYRTQLGERGVKISGGERQRIAIARAFLRDAPVLILDEPTSSIDSRTEEVILDALDRLMEGRTTIMVAHRLSTIRHADQIVVVNDGEIVQRGTHDSLLEETGLYRKLWEAQTRTRNRKRGFGSSAVHVPADALASQGRHAAPDLQVLEKALSTKGDAD
jgi:ABC-type multidrug transport system fused ATPase/permease subunit